MNKTIERIHREYGEIVLRMSLTHLFNIGADKLLNSDIEKDCADLIATTPANSILSGEMQANIHRCAAALAKIEVWEIFKFIQTEIQIHDVTVHPGRNLRFYDEDSGKVVDEFMVPFDTCENDIFHIVESMNVNCFVQGDRAGESIRNAFRKKGIRPEPIPFDLTFGI